MTVQHDTFLATVVNNVDLEMRGRVMVKSSAILQTGLVLPDWVEPSFPYAGPGHGLICVPAVGDVVEVEAIVGDTTDDTPGASAISNPDYRWRCAVYATPADLPPLLRVGYPFRLGLVTPSAQALVFDELAGMAMLFATLIVQIGSQSAAQPAVLGTQLASLLNALLPLLAAHTHPGPGTPPNNAADVTALVPNIAGLLSAKILLE